MFHKDVGIVSQMYFQLSMYSHNFVNLGRPADENVQIFFWTIRYIVQVFGIGLYPFQIVMTSFHEY